MHQAQSSIDMCHPCRRIGDMPSINYAICHRGHADEIRAMCATRNSINWTSTNHASLVIAFSISVSRIYTLSYIAFGYISASATVVGWVANAVELRGIRAVTAGK